MESFFRNRVCVGYLVDWRLFTPLSKYRYLKGEHRSTEPQAKSCVFYNARPNLQLVELGETTRISIYSPYYNSSNEAIAPYRIWDVLRKNWQASCVIKHRSSRRPNLCFPVFVDAPEYN